MLEIPSAVLAADSWFADVSFASLGTNDLTQYTLAVDRGQPGAGALPRRDAPGRPAADRDGGGECRAGGDQLSVCGEMGGDPAAALALVGLGVTQLSMGASLAAGRQAGDPGRLVGGAAGDGAARPPRPLGRGRAGPVHGPAARVTIGELLEEPALVFAFVYALATAAVVVFQAGVASGKAWGSTRWAAATPAGCRP